MPYLFRESFASGNVFSMSMLDTLLYQSFTKPYLPDLLKLLMGLSYNEGSSVFNIYKINKLEDI